MLPEIDVSPLREGSEGKRGRERVATEIGQACQRDGFFYVTGHGIPPERIALVERLFRDFFTRDLDFKMSQPMTRAGRSFRGYFPLHGELTSGVPDVKEGFYFGAEHPDEHPRVRAGLPFHGKNLFPNVPHFDEIVLSWMEDMTRLGHLLMSAIGESLGLPAHHLADRYLKEPTILFRAFHYPPPESPEGWGVGEHTDYGWLTILWQDDSGGLQVKSRSRWIEAPPIPGSFVCNIGDMLDRMTGGLYRSTPHRVRNVSGKNRLSLPFFFDPDWDARVEPIDTSRAIVDDAAERWDHASVHAFEGTYGEWLSAKVAKVFPML